MPCLSLENLSFVYCPHCWKSQATAKGGEWGWVTSSTPRPEFSGRVHHPPVLEEADGKQCPLFLPLVTPQLGHLLCYFVLIPSVTSPGPVITGTETSPGLCRVFRTMGSEGFMWPGHPRPRPGSSPQPPSFGCLYFSSLSLCP